MPKLHRKVFLLTILCVLSLFTLTAKGQSREYLTSKNYISTNVLKPLFRNITLRYVRMVSDKDAVRFDIDYGFPMDVNSYRNVYTFPIEKSDGSRLTITNRGTVTTSFTLSAGYARYFFPHINGFYVAGDLFYTYGYYDDKIYENCNGQTAGSGYYLESRRINNIGVKPQVGIKVLLNKGKPVQLLFDFYMGPVFYLSFQEITTKAYSSYCSSDNMTPYNPPQVSGPTSRKIGFQLGVNFCVGF